MTLWYGPGQQSMASYWDISGVSFQMEATDPRAAHLMRAAGAGFRLTCLPFAAEPRAAVRLRVHYAEPSFNLSAGRLLRAAPGWRCLSNAQQTWFVLAIATVVIPHSRDLVEVFLFPHHRPWSPALLGQIFGCALHALLQPHGLHYLHGAGLLAPNRETGMLIVGASGCGKSTLTLQLVASGWRYLTDDLLLLDGRQQQSDVAIIAHGFRRHFAISPEALRHNGLGKTFSLSINERKDKTCKHWLLPEKFFPTGYVAQCAPQVLVFPQLTQATESRLELISPPDALLSVLQETPLVTYDPASTRAQVQTLTRLVEQTRAWRLHAGRDLLLQPDRASQLLASLF